MRAGFSAPLTWDILGRLRVTNFAAAPTVYRALRDDPTPVPGGLALRCCTSAGEPLTPALTGWAEDALGCTIREQYGQTELGMCVINGWHPDVRRAVKPGSIGQAMPGWEMEILLPDRDEPAPTGTRGRLAVDVTGSPLMTFTGYVDAPERTGERFSADAHWFYTGDTALKDDDGYLFFSARDDDVIIMAGYRIGPSEVESVLVSHAAVAEAAVVGRPDKLRGEVVEAFVVLRPGAAPSDALAVELQQLVRRNYAAHAYPRRLHFLDELPKDPGGKVQRCLLRRSEVPGRGLTSA